mmetsp:Transcript_32512/g.67199  ORF Transcript_32512/g.67199 Transcript_32512/m.67199 type:complete len:139 (-) Transcript_32512:91-507(-)
MPGVGRASATGLRVASSRVMTGVGQRDVCFMVHWLPVETFECCRMLGQKVAWHIACVNPGSCEEHTCCCGQALPSEACKAVCRASPCTGVPLTHSRDLSAKPHAPGLPYLASPVWTSSSDWVGFLSVIHAQSGLIRPS